MFYEDFADSFFRLKDINIFQYSNRRPGVDQTFPRLVVVKEENNHSEFFQSFLQRIKCTSTGLISGLIFIAWIFVNLQLNDGTVLFHLGYISFGDSDSGCYNLVSSTFMYGLYMYINICAYMYAYIHTHIYGVYNVWNIKVGEIYTMLHIYEFT